MKVYKTTLKEVFGDDPNSPFWQRMNKQMIDSGFMDKLDYVMEQSAKHGKPFDDIDPALLDPRAK